MEERIKSVRESVVDATHNDRKNIRNLAKELWGQRPIKTSLPEQHFKTA